MKPRSRGAIWRPGFAIRCPPGEQRAQGMPGAQPHPQSSWAEKENAHKSSGRAETSGTPCAMALRLTPRSPRSTGLVSLRRRPISALRPQGRKSHLDRLDPSVGGTAPRGLTVRVVPHVLRQNTSIATRLPSGDEWPNVPRVEAGWRSQTTSSDLRKQIYFYQNDWTFQTE